MQTQRHTYDFVILPSSFWPSDRAKSSIIAYNIVIANIIINHNVWWPRVSAFTLSLPGHRAYGKNAHTHTPHNQECGK